MQNNPTQTPPSAINVHSSYHPKERPSFNDWYRYIHEASASIRGEVNEDAHLTDDPDDYNNSPSQKQSS